MRTLTLSSLLFVISSFLLAQSEDPVSLVDPFIGTDGHGHTFPGATVPFGMVQLSPDTRVEGWDACGGYHYSDSTILGFSHTHLSGTGVGDYGDILFVPQSGKPHVVPGTDPSNGYRMLFRHEDESASPGYYSVNLKEEGIRVELSASNRAGMHRYTYASPDSAWLLIDLVHGIGPDVVLESSIRVVTPHEIAGMRRSRGWANDQVVYFVVKFSSPITSFDVFQSDSTSDRTSEGSGTYVKGLIRFGELGNNPLIARIGLSSVDEAGAGNNLHEEMHHWKFDSVRANAAQAWREALGRVAVEGGTLRQRRTFATALYHSFIAPNLFSDADGRYRTMVGSVYTARNFSRYTVFSLWDTFRATHPLFTILEPDRTNDFIESFLAIERQAGTLPVWELAANETWCMIGYHSVPVIVDAYVKGIRGYDAVAALAAMRRTAMKDHYGLQYCRLYGYVPSERESESVSKSLEYAYDDWCISVMAGALGREEDRQLFGRRAENFRNLFDRSSGFFRAKENGAWRVPFDPRAVTIDYTEANAWQYAFFAPHNIKGLIELHGGDRAFVKKLDELFTTSTQMTGRDQADITGLIGQYAHGNEPSHHMAYLYAYAGEPWKTQERVRQIRDELYADTPDGLIGNEDCGQMSSWYVFSALGFYPVTPGVPHYVIGTPLFDKAAIALPNGRTFTVLADRTTPDAFFVQSITLNGAPLERSWVTHEEILRGGTLQFRLKDTPDRSWATDPDGIPLTPTAEAVVLTPVASVASRSFEQELSIALTSDSRGATIRYTTDGTDPRVSSARYDRPLRLTETTKLKARAFVRGLEPSGLMESEYVKRTRVGAVVGVSAFSPQYSAGGEQALVDGVLGVEDFRVGGWQGFEGSDLSVVIDLGAPRPIASINARFLHDNNAWIFYPKRVVYLTSDDGVNFSEVWHADGLVASDAPGAVIKGAMFDTAGMTARFVKVEARNIGVCPPWHKGAGGKAWLFVDEVEIR